jgi:transposase-like protein
METISMSGKERRRLEAVSRVEAREYSLARAADLLGISGRQAKRSWVRYHNDGDAGLVLQAPTNGCVAAASGAGRRIA